MHCLMHLNELKHLSLIKIQAIFHILDAHLWYERPLKLQMLCKIPKIENANTL